MRRILKGEGAVINRHHRPTFITSRPMLPYEEFWHTQKKADFMIHIQAPFPRLVSVNLTFGSQ